MRFQVDGLNIHHKLKVSMKKPFGGKSSFVNNVIKHPGATLVGATVPGLGPLGSAVGALADNANTNALNKAHDANSQLNRDPGMGNVDQAQIEALYRKRASDYSTEAQPFREQLVNSLTNSGAELFKKTNPYILQDLNSRGLFTSESAVNKSQSDALSEIAAENRNTLNDFDTDIFNNTQQLKTTGVTSGLQRTFDVADRASQERLAKYLAKKQSRDQLINSLIGFGANVGSSAFLA